MGMISYAQNREDVLLARVFPGPTGFYVDIGAADPVEYSVTKWFYDRGWSGVNVEPQANLYETLTTERPRDVNLNVAVSVANGESTFHEVENISGWSTLEPNLVGMIEASGGKIRSYTVRTMTLERILETHAAGRVIDFIKIDVEGHEREVLLSFDIQKWRPRVLVLEATRPNSPEPSHRDWETIILAQGYAFAFFDGLNRYYVRPEDESLIPKLAVSPNPFDAYVPYDHLQAIRTAEQLEARLVVTHQHADYLQTELTSAQQCAAQQQAEANAARAQADHLHIELSAARQEAEQLRAELGASHLAAEELRGELAAARADLDRLRATTAPRAALDTALAILAMTREHLESVQTGARRRVA